MGLDEKIEERKIECYGTVEGEKIIVKVDNKVQELYQSGFGKIDGENLILDLYEGLYLNELKKIEVLYKGKNVGFNELMEVCYKKDKNVLTNYLVYRDLKNRGFIVKKSEEFGVDFYVYEKDDYWIKRAKYAIFVLNEGCEVDFKKIFEKIKEVKNCVEESIIAVLDRRGEVIYYRASEETFNEKR
ncbi:MAG: tRNA-intron lyase [Nitrososphaeria archaeon]